MASRLVCFTPDQAVQVWAMAGDILSCSWARHFTHIVSPHPVTSCYRNWDKLRPAGPLGSYMHSLPLNPNYENYYWQCMCKVLINFFHIVNCSFVITENRNKIPQDRDWHFKFIIKPWYHTTLHNIHCTQGYLLGHVYKNISHSFLFLFSKVGLKPNSRNILDP